jgi:tetratricopeptide (TPR) repeat protein
VERRLAIHASADAQALSRRGASRAGCAALAALLLAAAAGTAGAQPKTRAARAAFNKGVTAYQKGNFQAAADALGKSFEIERDPDTLFAWAQAERKLDHCDKAIVLYEQLLQQPTLPDANRTAVEQKLAECRTIVAQVAPPSAETAVAPPSTTRSEPVTTGADSAPAAASLASPAFAPESSDAGSPVYHWYKDPVGLSLLGVGIAAAGVGGGYLLSARSVASDAKAATNYDQVKPLNDKVDQRNKIGAGALIVGGVLVAGGAGWILWKQHDSGERRVVTGWLLPGTGGVALSGRF